MPYYAVRHLAGQLEELSCLIQLEDEGAAMYFNIVHGAKVRRRFTTKPIGSRCEDYLLVARDVKAPGLEEEREIALYDLLIDPDRKPGGGAAGLVWMDRQRPRA